MTKTKKILIVLLATLTMVTMSAASVFAASATELTSTNYTWGGALVTPARLDENAVLSKVNNSSDEIYVNLGKIHGIVYKVTAASAGHMTFHLNYVSGNSYLFAVTGDNEKSFTASEKEITTLSSSDNSADIEATVTAGQTLYIALYSNKLDSNNDAATFEDNYKITAEFTPTPTTAEMTSMAIGTTYAYWTKATKASYTYGFTAKTSGDVCITPAFIKNPSGVTSGADIGTVYLMSSDKKVKSAKRTIYLGQKKYFGVKKGVKYYFVYTPKTGYLGNEITLNAANTSRTYDPTTKVKAKTIKSGGSSVSYFYLNKKASHWYKVNVTKSGKHKFTLTKNFIGICNMQIYKGSKAMSYKSGKAYNLSKGTYYIKIYNGNTSSTGLYNLAYK